MVVRLAVIVLIFFLAVLIVARKYINRTCSRRLIYVRIFKVNLESNNSYKSI
jgi:hypothetical protein